MTTLKTNLNVLQEKAKERTVKTQSIEYDLETLVKKIRKGIIKLDPEYQRRHRWNNEISSKLIESLVLNIPIPIVFLSQDFDVDTETEESRYSVIDGQQRLTAIYRFFNNQFELESLKTLEDLNGCAYKDLPPFLVRRLEERTIKCLRIDSTIDAQVKIDIFERLNSGSIKLEAQELRNAVYSGPFNDACKALSVNPDFRKMLQIHEGDDNYRVKKMEDVELVLRFFALVDDNYLNFKKTKDKPFRDFLSEELEKFNKYTDLAIEEAKNRFNLTISIVHKYFGDQAFAKYKPDEPDEQDAGRLILQSKFNAAVYDALVISVDAEVRAGGRDISKAQISKYNNLFRDDKFHDSISGSILDRAKIIYRIEEARKVFR